MFETMVGLSDKKNRTFSVEQPSIYTNKIVFFRSYSLCYEPWILP